MRAVDQYRTYARYNAWMNARLYDVASRLSDEERKRDLGAFFHSVHGTLNHILLADRIWFGRFIGRPIQVQSLRQELFADFNELRAERTLTDQDIEGWTQGLTDAQLAGKVKFTTIVNPATRVYDLWVCVTHFFNHQTHHRGQVTALLSQCGKDYGVTDLLWLPELTPPA